MQSEEEYAVQLSMWIDGTHGNQVIDRYYEDYRRTVPEATKQDFKEYMLGLLFPKVS